MITLEQYVGPHANSPDWTERRKNNARDLLWACSRLQLLAENDGIIFHINPNTGSQVSGENFGGFRPQSCPQGAPKSSHKEGMAVDIYDPNGAIDTWCMANFHHLENCGIYIEHPSKTVGWSHWTTRRPMSGNRAFYP